MSALLQASKLLVKFGGLCAVDDVSFSLERGELLGLIGPNGAGKTTCLKAISGQLIANAGLVLLDGQPIQDLPIHRRVRQGMAVTHQLVRPVKLLSVLDNVAFAWGHMHEPSLWHAAWHVDRAPARAAALQILADLGIADYADRPAGLVPLGVRKRLEMARAIAHQPRVLLLDEPLAGLNSTEASRLADLIRQLADGGLSIVLIEHNLGEVTRVCDRLVVLETGRKIAEGAPRQVIADPAVITAYLGSETEDA